MSGRAAAARAAIAARIRRGCDDGDLPKDTDVTALAEYVDVVLAGLSARARDGATRAHLDASINRAMAAWPATAHRACDPTALRTTRCSESRRRRARGEPADGRGRIYDSNVDTTGDTPLVRLDRLAAERGVKANLLGTSEAGPRAYGGARPQIGHLLPAQEPALTAAIHAAFDLD